MSYANDGSWESVERLAQNLARKFYRRVEGLQLNMDLDDCMGEVRLAYVKARKAWSPEKARFSTYFTTTACNEFNRAIEKLAVERRELGMFSYDSDGEADEDEQSYLDRSSGMLTSPCPSARMESRETLAQVLNMLSQDSRTVVAVLLRDEMNRSGSPLTFKEICASVGIARTARTRVPSQRELAVREELKALFGVEFR
jgi:RNA polymerase sigma factor (sigma-70 family)